MTDLLLVLLINFFALYTTSQYLAVLKKEEQKKTWRCLLPAFPFMVCVKYVLFDSDSYKRSSKLI